MDEIAFDRLTRLIGSRASRRAALVALAGAGVGGALGVAGPDEAAARCGGGKACGLCKRCKNGTCKKRKNGAFCADDGGVCQGKQCVCPSETWLCTPAAACCAAGQACFRDVYGSSSCGACPDVTDLCGDAIPQCGQFDPDPYAVCGCVTSIEGATVCSSGFYQCVACTTDQDCADALGAPAVCIDVASKCSDCETSTICMTATCEAPVVLTAAGKRNVALKRVPRTKIVLAAPAR